MKQYEKHELNIFPEIIGDDYERLKNDLLKNGYDEKQPIYLYEGKIIDGWNRYKVCKELNITPVFKNYIGSDLDAIHYVLRTNKRRNLNSGQWAGIANEAEEIIARIEAEVEKERRRKQRENATNQYIQNKQKELSKKPSEYNTLVTQKDDKGNSKIVNEISGSGELIPQRQKRDEKKDNANRTRTKLADEFNTNPRYISDMKRLKKEDFYSYELVKNGKITLTEVMKQKKKEKRLQQINQIKKNIETENKTVNDKFDVIAIDPPWEYSERGGFSSKQHDQDTNRGGVDYPTMTVEQLKQLDLPVKDNCVLYLWTTHAFMRDAYNILDAWGFTYKAIITWDKEIIGMGRNIRLQCEFCLLATKGKPLIEGSSVRDIIREKRREHSRKPEQFYSIVEQMTTGKRLDYFAREKREGWEVFGAELNKFTK